MKDNLIFDHFKNKWVSFEDTQSYLERREWVQTIRGLAAGVLVSLLMALMVLLIALGLWGK